MQTRAAMGTLFEVRVWTPVEEAASVPMARVWSELERCEQALSDYRATSEARRLLRTSEWTGVGEILWEAVQQGDALHRTTGGVVDATVGPLTRLWRRAARQGALPSAERIRRAQEAVGWALLERRDGPELRPGRDGMRLDFGAFGKGLALDRMGRILTAAGHPRFLIDGGGDLLVGDPPPRAAGWDIRIEAAPGDGSTLTLAGCAIATSGLSARPLVIDGVRIGHILDARTGAWLDRDVAATVVAPSASQADGWATALCVLGPSGLSRLPAGSSGRVVQRDARGSPVSASGVLRGEAPRR